jgi:hypothetical protein
MVFTYSHSFPTHNSKRHLLAIVFHDVENIILTHLMNLELRTEITLFGGTNCLNGLNDNIIHIILLAFQIIHVLE